jgi:hypothetical protein
MKYLADNMLNRLSTDLPAEGLDCETIVHAIRGSNDPGTEVPDAEIFRFLLEQEFELRRREVTSSLVLITSDKDLAKYCQEFGLRYLYREKPNSPEEFDQMASKLIEELRNQK